LRALIEEKRTQLQSDKPAPEAGESERTEPRT
jgi:hypothetical protein